MNHIIAIDLGTSGMKAILFDEDGRIIKQAEKHYGSVYGENNSAEQDPDDWWEACIFCIKALGEGEPGLGNVIALGVSGQMMAGLAVDGSGQPVAPALIHADTRAIDENEAAIAALGFEKIYALSGHRPSPAYSGPKMAWMRHREKAQYRRAAYFLNPKDYLNFRLCGEIATDWSDASGTLLFNIHNKMWDDDLLAAFNVDWTKLPPVVASSERLGRISGDVASLTGLPDATIVAAGAGDGICAGIGAAAVEPGITYNYIGTTSWIAGSGTEPITDPEMRLITFAHAVPGLFHSMGVMQSAGASIEWFRREYLGHIEDTAAAFAELDRLMASSVPGSRGVLFLPYLMGERSPWWNRDCRAAWYGLSQEHGLADLTRSVFEGVSHNLALIAEILDSLAPFGGLSVLGGGGLSEQWSQMLCNSYGKTLSVHEDTVSITARGAAIIAGIAAGLYTDYTVAKKFVKIEKTFQPEKEQFMKMKELRREFVALYKKLYG